MPFTSVRFSVIIDSAVLLDAVQMVSRLRAGASPRGICVLVHHLGRRERAPGAAAQLDALLALTRSRWLDAEGVGFREDVGDFVCLCLSDRDEIEEDLKEWVSSSLASRCGISARRPSDSLGGVAEGKASAIAVCVDVIERAVYEEGRAKSSSIEALAAVRPRQAGHAAVPESLPHRGSAPAHLRRSLRS